MVLASREKLGTASPFQVLALDDANGLVIEADLPREVLKPYRDLGLFVARA